ncbi:beta-galactosidase [Bacillus sp. TS-2]|nr:beta-galactosidase [Bacillus sp. TS-2]
MKEFSVNISPTKKEVFPASIDMGDQNVNGDQFQLTNYYFKKNGQPFYGICGEFHFSRYDNQNWEDELIKMKMAGINIVPTYIFWNHHEEVQGEFDWKGNKNVRKFIELCDKHGLYVIIRIGPFCHGEVRNGGMPDWLYGRPFQLRSNDSQYLEFVKVLYQEISKQIQGLLFEDGGPIIGTQIENEHQHAGAPWEMTTGSSNEWVHAGGDGDEHIKVLKQLAQDVGIVTPMYTCTAWGGASAPSDEVLPLWGGYAFWPWIFYGDATEHPATPEYIYRDFHNNDKDNYGFTPNYPAENLPYACCEMGGGMTNFYQYRFKLPYESVDAMANIKVAGGCNFVGYYVFHGGQNPTGKKTPFLNESATPKISYDYQAPIGEFGQIRASYRRLKRQHYFYKEVENSFCEMKTTLPNGAEDIEPKDVETPRFAIRSNGESGYLFINNYQDHVKTQKQEDFSLFIELEKESIQLPSQGGLALEKDESCILPFNLDLNGCTLQYATAQFMTSIEVENESYYFFYTPNGLTSEYMIKNSPVATITGTGIETEEHENHSLVKVINESHNRIDIHLQNGKTLHICTLSDKDSQNFWKFSRKGQDYVFVTEATVLVSEEDVRLEIEDPATVELKVFPPLKEETSFKGCTVKKEKQQPGLFETYDLSFKPKQEKVLRTEQVSDSQLKLEILPSAFSDVKELLIKVDYVGDIGYAYIDGELIHDHFYNGGTWEIGLKKHEEKLKTKEIYLYVSPYREGSYVKSDSPMAARTEMSEKKIATLDKVTYSIVTECLIDM